MTDKVVIRQLPTGVPGLDEERFSPHGTAFLTDAIILQRYVELSGAAGTRDGVVKVRASVHANEIRLYDITDDGIAVGDVLDGYDGLLSGRPTASVRAGATRTTPRKRRQHQGH